MLINLHDGSLITTSVAVIGCTENGHHVPVLTPIISLHDQLMRSSHQCQPVVVIKRFTDVLSERVSRSSWTNAPATSIVWITPEQIAHRSLMWYLLDPVQTSDII